MLERLGGGAGNGRSRRARAARTAEPAKAKANIPRGTNGVYADADQAAKAARKAFEQNERTPVATRAKMVEAMRKAVLANNDALSRYAVEETGLGRYEDKLVEEPARRREDAGLRDPAPQSRTPATTA